MTIDYVVWAAPTYCVVRSAAAWLAVAVSMHLLFRFVPSVDSIVVMNFQSPLEVHAVLISYLVFLFIYFCFSFVVIIFIFIGQSASSVVVVIL